MAAPYVLPDALLADVSAFVAARYGLHFPPERWADLERSIAATAREIDVPDASACAHRIVSESLTRSHAEILAAHLTTGETYFFREKGALAMLEQRILPELIRARGEGERRLRVWSAGCSTGEEPYSVAMLLDRLIPDQRAWDITILATDVNAASLAKAAKGVYGEWSFRDAPAWIRPCYFDQPEDGRFELRPHIRSRVTFAKLNLAEATYPSAATNTLAMDVILCRNVLIYLTPDHVPKVIHNLYRALLDGGWLLVSPSETSHRWFPQFVPVSFPEAMLYRRKDAGAGVERPAPAADDATSASAAPPPSRAGSPESARAAVHVLLERTPRHTAFSTLARARANQGNLAEALAWCDRWIATDKLNAGCHYLRALVLIEQGDLDEAALSLRRAAYLQQDFVLAHFAQGNLARRRGATAEAQRHFTNALRLLDAYDADDVLPESDGLTAGRLMATIHATARPDAAR